MSAHLRGYIQFTPETILYSTILYRFNQQSQHDELNYIMGFNRSDSEGDGIDARA
jgi:hypothetical protein